MCALNLMIICRDTWLTRQVCDDIVYNGNLLKFSQNQELRSKLLGTGDKLLVEVMQ